MVKQALYPCGQCLPCRLNRRRTWTHRIMLESLCHDASTFVTLTYDDENVPRTAADLMTLEPKDYVNFLKRLRKRVHPCRIRFFLVGEYGDEHGRPHYHAALFNFMGCRNGRTMRFRGRPMAARCCSVCRMVGEEWGHGDVDLGTVEVSSAQYLAGYTTKKMTRYDDVRLFGRNPEFARMSLRPGIGADFLWDVASTMLEFDLAESEADVPSALRHAARVWPMGRYLRKRLRTLVGKDAKAPQAALDEVAAKMLPLRLAARASSDAPSLKAQVIQAFRQDVLNMETRSKIFKKRGSI